MINLVSDTIDREDINALIEWLQKDPIPQLTKGPLTKELESKWAKKVGTEYSVFVNSGSSGILLLLAAYKEILGYNPKIVVPALSWVTDVSSPMLLGYDVRLCDCNLRDLSCDLKELREIFAEFKPDIFISVAPLGLIPDMDSIVNLCKEFNVILIEDNCESMGSRIGAEMLGRYGDSSVFSMYYGHHLSTIEGGFINTSDTELYNFLVSMRNHGWDRDWDAQTTQRHKKKWNVEDFNSLYTFYYPGLNLRSTDLQAFIGLRQLDKLARFSKKRNYNFRYYLKHIKDNILTLKERGYISNFAYPVVSIKKDRIVRELQENGVVTRPLIAGSIGKQPFWIKKHGSYNYPNADLIHKFGFYLPNHQDLSEKDMDFIIEILNR
ncbi:MAG TPA: DegT/DnrJ/EryC1/StrS aminotransferase family protein [Patescibacteria group bacterium]|nr:DegT/DnrJ/EryC1/StrS aminotransferase family protein [Patescibacteria group bacterium]